MTVTSVSTYRQRQQEGEEWTAPSGAVILVRNLDITDHAIINHFPDYLRRMMYEALASSARLSGKTDEDQDTRFFDGLDGEDILTREREIGNKLLILGWINPRVVETVTDPDTELGVDEVSAADRRAYMARVFGAVEQEAQQLATFPGRPAGSVGTVRRVPDVPAPAEREAPAGAEILRSDGV